MQLADDGDAAVGRIRPPTRKDELARHEGMAVMAASEKDQEILAATVEQDQGRSVARPHRLAAEGKILRFGLVELLARKAVHFLRTQIRFLLRSRGGIRSRHARRRSRACKAPIAGRR